MLSLILLHLALAFVCFLMALNGYLRGSKRDIVDAVPGIVWIAGLGTVFVFFGPVAGLAGVVMSLLYMIVAIPIAAKVAR